jgi:hypothetical protein
MNTSVLVKFHMNVTMNHIKIFGVLTAITNGAFFLAYSSIQIGHPSVQLRIATAM